MSEFISVERFLFVLLVACQCIQAGVEKEKLDSVRSGSGHVPIDIYTPVAHFRGNTYFVSVDQMHRPTVTQVTESGKSETVYLDKRSDYKAFPDPHNGFSIGVDPDGFLHITGDMHQFGSGHARNGNFLYPDRYDDNKNVVILYWRSIQPLDVRSGFRFCGTEGDDSVIPGRSWSYGRFFNDPNGTLYYSARVLSFVAKSYHKPHARTGAMAVGLYRYDSVSKTWGAIGGWIPHPSAENVKQALPVFYWSYSGRPDTDRAYQTYQAAFNFDRDGRLHFAAAGHVGDGTITRLVYACSDDQGATWRRADGTIIPGLPLQGDDGAKNLADVVTNAKSGAIVKVIADRNGVPAVKMGVANNGWFVYLDGNWRFDADILASRAFQRPNGELLFTAPWGVWRVDDLTRRKFERIAPGIEVPSQYGVLSTGNLYGVMIDKQSGLIQILAYRFSTSVR